MHEQAGREISALLRQGARTFGEPRRRVHRLMVIVGQPLLVSRKGGEASLQILADLVKTALNSFARASCCGSGTGIVATPTAARPCWALHLGHR
jgi:hypothetical protein